MFSFFKKSVKPKFQVIELTKKIYEVHITHGEYKERAYYCLGSYGHYLIGGLRHADLLFEFFQGGGGIKHILLPNPRPDLRQSCERLFKKFGAQVAVQDPGNGIFEEWAMPKIAIDSIGAPDLEIEIESMEIWNITVQGQRLEFFLSTDGLVLNNRDDLSQSGTCVLRS